MEKAEVLLISGGGLLGAALAKELPRAGIRCLATSRREAGPVLDLERTIAPQLRPLLERGRFTHAILSAAMADVDDCFRQPERSQRINVDGPCELFGLLRKAGIMPVFVSTDLVFDGERDLGREEDLPGPLCRYARQKVATEVALREAGAEHLIFRVCKMMAMDLHPRSILSPIVAAAAGHGSYRAFRDQFITPVFVEDVARAVATSLGGLSGTFHLAGDERFSRLELARRVAHELELDLARIEEAARDEVSFLEPRGRCNTLSAQKFRKATGFEFTPLSEGLAEIRRRL